MSVSNPHYFPICNNLRNVRMNPKFSLDIRRLMLYYWVTEIVFPVVGNRLPAEGLEFLLRASDIEEIRPWRAY